MQYLGIFLDRPRKTMKNLRMAGGSAENAVQTIQIRVSRFTIYLNLKYVARYFRKYMV
jgi:hypothetical protein